MQTTKQTHGLVALETRVFLVNIRAAAITMEKIKIPMDTMYLKRVRGVSFLLWTSSWDTSLPPSTLAAVMMVYCMVRCVTVIPRTAKQGNAGKKNYAMSSWRRMENEEREQGKSSYQMLEQVLLPDSSTSCCCPSGNWLDFGKYHR
jgi:hypothetical protein